MSAWLVLFRAEFLRVLPALPFVLLLHGLMFCIRIERGIDLSARLASLVEWGTWALAGGIVVTSLWMDSPFRRERFLAVRPVKPLVLYSAKFAALFLLAGLPFIAVEFVNLLAWGWSGSSVLFGTLQMALVVLVQLLAAFPLVWLWRGRISGVIGTVLMYLVAERTMSELGKLRYNSFTILLYPPVTLLFLGSLALLLAALIAIPGRFRHLLKTLLFLPATGLAVLITAWACTPNPGSIERGESVPLVQLYFTPQPRQDKYEETFNVRIPAPAAPADVEVEWHLTRLEAKGNNFARGTSDNWVGGGHYGLRSPAMQKALRARYGTAVRLPDPEIEAKGWQGGTLIDARDDAGRLNLALTARRTLFGFEVVGELPIKPGASLRQGDLLWTVESGPGDLWSAGAPFAGVYLRTPSLWLGSLKPENDVAYHLFLFEASGKIQKMGSWYYGPRGPRGAGKLRRFTARLSELGITSEAELPADARLVIVRTAVISGSSYSWKSPQPIPLKEGRNMDYTERPPVSPNAAKTWLKEHPAPAGDATADEVSEWLMSLLRQIPREDPRLPGFQVYVEAIGKVVPKHPDRVLRAVKETPDSLNSAQNAGYMALKQYLQRDAVQRFPEMLEDGVIRYTYVEKGWSADIVPYQVRRSRLNFESSDAYLLLQNPEATGFSEAEWLALFRLYPEGHVFTALNGKFVRKELLEAEADRMLNGFSMAESRYPGEFLRLLRLAVARGRSDVPQILAAWIPRWRERGKGSPNEVSRTISHYFSAPEPIGPDKTAVDWFVEQNPGAFRFDPATGKYRLP